MKRSKSPKRRSPSEQAPAGDAEAAGPLFVFSNLATTLDGKIASADRSLFPLGTPEDRRQMLRLRAECDVVLMGASTLRAWKKPCLAEAPGPHPLNAVVSSSLEGFSPTWDFFKSQKIERLLLVGERTPPARLRKFEKSSAILTLKKPTPKLPIAVQIMNALSGLGRERLLVEGGGGLMWDFVSHDLIDEYHVTLTPRLLGGITAPTLVDGTGLKPSETVNVKLEQCRILGDELYLIYRRTGRRG